MKIMKGAFFLRTAPAVFGRKRTIVAGIVLDDLLQDKAEDQMWFCNLSTPETTPGGHLELGGHLVLNPLLILEEAELFKGCTINQVLTGNFQDPRHWKRILLNRTGQDIEVDR